MVLSLDVLITRNLTLRPPLDVDADDIAEALANPQVAQNFHNIPAPYTLDAARRWIDECRMSANSGMVYTVHKERLIGVVEVQMRHARATLSFWFVPPVWGRGYATQATRATLAHAFRHIGTDVIEANTHGNNPAAKRVLEKLGFEETSESNRAEAPPSVRFELTRHAFETRFGALETETAA